MGINTSNLAESICPEPKPKLKCGPGTINKYIFVILS